MKTSLTVILPAYRAEKYLAEAVESVLSQNWGGDLEILVINDGSTDGTADIAAGLPVKLFEKEQGGAASARNLGLFEAGGELICFLDADDVLCEGALAALNEARESRDVRAVFGRAEDFISPELTVEERASLRPRKGSYTGVLPGCSLIERSVFEEIGCFDSTLKSGETVAWMMKLRDQQIPTAQIDVVTLKRRLHLTNTGRVNPRQEMTNYAALLRARMKRK